MCVKVNPNTSFFLYIRFLLLFLLFASTSFSQPDSVVSPEPIVSVFGNPKLVVQETFNAGLGVVMSPFRHWNQRKLLNTSILLGTASLSCFFMDKPIDVFLKSKVSTKSQILGRTYSEVGNPLLVGSAILGFDLLGHVSSNSRLNRVAFLSAQSFAISMSFCYATKHLSGRLRPNHTNSHDLWYGPNWTENPKRSFFSGHTTALFSFVTVIAMEYQDIWWLPVTLYAVAGTTALSRLTAGDHWFSDVVFSAVFSHLVARSVVARWRNKEKKNRIVPVYSSNGGGFRLNF